MSCKHSIFKFAIRLDGIEDSLPEKRKVALMMLLVNEEIPLDRFSLHCDLCMDSMLHTYKIKQQAFRIWGKAWQVE